MTNRLLVLCWHNVEATWSFPARPGAGLAGLRRQLKVLKRHANVVPLHASLESLKRGEQLPPRAVALTFDDGYRDNIELAAPMLDSLGLPATFFLVPGLLDNSVSPWWEGVSRVVSVTGELALRWAGTTLPLTTAGQRAKAVGHVQQDLKALTHADRLAAVEELATRLTPGQAVPSAEDLFMDWDGAASLVRRGFDIGSHTCQHAILGRETPAAQLEDLTACRHALESRLDVGAPVLAYPNGERHDYDQHTLAAARAAGHEWAMTTTEGFAEAGAPPLETRRVVMFPQRGVLELVLNLRYALRAQPSGISGQ